MTFTQASIQALREDDFTREVLVPLFEAMGYRDVRFHGGGILEQGKDMTMWLEHAVRGRTNFAGVVKAVAITGEANTAMIVSQLRQAFAHPFRDGLTGDEHRVHECFVITSQPMRKEAVFTLRNVIDGETFGRYVAVLDGDAVWRLVVEHLAPRATLGALLEGYRRLSERSKYAVDVAMNNSGTEFTIRPKEGGPIEVPTLQFPDTPTGKLNKVAYDEFLRSGTPATLDLAAVDGLQGMGLLSELGVSADGGLLRVSRSSTPFLIGELRCRGDEGAVVKIPGLVFAATGGAEMLTITNSRQNVPLHFTFDTHFDAESGGIESASVTLNSNLRGWSVYWYVLFAHFLQIVSKKCTATLWDARTGIEHSIGELQWAGAPIPALAHVRVAERVLRIQELTKQPIMVPQRDFFTAEDIENIEFVESAITKGRQTATSMNFDLVALGNDPADWKRRFEQPIKNLRVGAEDVSRLVLDTYVPLGPMEVVCTRGRMVVDNLEAALEDATQGRPVQVTVVPTGAGTITARYPAWKKKRH